MIEITCNNEQYSYNAYHITKAFFPAQDITQKIDANATVSVWVCLPDSEGNRRDVRIEEATKRLVDRALYEAYRSYTGQAPAWGILTGIRPTKLAMEKLRAGISEEDFVEEFGREMLVSEEKARLAVDIAKREQQILAPLDYQDGYSLYVGIPFCPSVCSYCSFSSGSVAQWGDWMEAYVDALCKELTYVGRACMGRKLNTIYIGGGTPTTLTEAQLEQLLCHIEHTFSREHLLEYTVEAGRPDSITEGKLRLLKAHGVTRISINPQTMQQKTLDLVGRRHTTEQTKEAYYLARTLGFDNINMDIIAGLPGETIADMEDTLRQIQQLDPDSLTVHSLAIKRAAKMGQERTIQRQAESELKPSSEADDREQTGRMAETLSGMIEVAAQKAGEMKLHPYYLYRQKNIAGNFENVGYAKVDKAGIYNILIMEEVQSIIAVGAGASTKIVLKEPVLVPGSRNKRKTTLMRVENVKDIKEYITRVDEMIERKGEWLWH